MGRVYYAVRRGRATGIYTTWKECEQQVSGLAEAEYKSFKLKREAQVYLSEEQTTSLAADNHVYILEYDGASKGNPGRAGAGAVLRDSNGLVVEELCLALDTATNNFAEYQGLILGLRGALERSVSRICVRGDSNLVCKQVTGDWVVKKETLKPLHAEAKRLSEQFAEFSIQHIKRELNSAADALANRAISEQGKNAEADDAGVHLPESNLLYSDEQGDKNPVKSRTKKRRVAEEPLYLLEYHGTSKGNPGKAGVGVLIRDSSGCLVENFSIGIGTATNSFAEYTALLSGLKAALEKEIFRIKVSGDSSLVYKQVNGEWAVKSENLRQLHAEVLALKKQFKEFTIHHVDRKCNKDAVALSNKAVEGTAESKSVVKLVENKVSEEVDLQDEPLYMLEYDGASKGNPGKAGAGALIRNSSGRVVEKMYIGLGEATNNVAEYEGLILGLKAALARRIARIHASGDSTLVCKQMAGEWVVKNETLKSLHAAALSLSKQFPEFRIHQVARDFNTEADALANRGTALPYRKTVVKLGRNQSKEPPGFKLGKNTEVGAISASPRTHCRLYHSLPDRNLHPFQSAVKRPRYFPRSATGAISVVAKFLTLFNAV